MEVPGDLGEEAQVVQRVLEGGLVRPAFGDGGVEGVELDAEGVLVDRAEGLAAGRSLRRRW